MGREKEKGSGKSKHAGEKWQEVKGREWLGEERRREG